MRVVRYDRFDGIGGLWLDEVPVPAAAPGQAVVQVQASCINPGSVSALHGSSYVPIRDLAGSVVDLGEGEHGPGLGDEVLGWAQDWSAHAEFVAVRVEQLVSKPAGLSWDVAGCLSVTPMAGLAAVRAADPQAGEVVAVSGASGGVGLTVAQLALSKGATVIGIASSHNAARLRAYGVVPVPYGDRVERDVRAAAQGRPIDAFIDAFGSGYVDLALALGVPTERINTVVDYRAAHDKGVKAVGTRDAGGIPALRELADLAATGQLDVPIAGTYPLKDVQLAYETLVARRHYGRIVLHPQE